MTENSNPIKDINAIKIVNGTQVNTLIIDIVNNASNNNISNMEVDQRH
jgi:hypothetical protein